MEGLFLALRHGQLYLQPYPIYQKEFAYLCIWLSNVIRHREETPREVLTKKRFLNGTSSLAGGTVKILYF